MKAIAARGFAGLHRRRLDDYISPANIRAL